MCTWHESVVDIFRDAAITIRPSTCASKSATYSTAMSLQTLPTPSSMTKQFYTTNSPWERVYSHYCAIQVGQQIYVSGTTAADPNSPPDAPHMLCPGDACGQT